MDGIKKMRMKLFSICDSHAIVTEQNFEILYNIFFSFIEQNFHSYLPNPIFIHTILPCTVSSPECNGLTLKKYIKNFGKRNIEDLSAGFEDRNITINKLISLLENITLRDEIMQIDSSLLVLTNKTKMDCRWKNVIEKILQHKRFFIFPKLDFAAIPQVQNLFPVKEKDMLMTSEISSYSKYEFNVIRKLMNL